MALHTYCVLLYSYHLTGAVCRLPCPQVRLSEELLSRDEGSASSSIITIKVDRTHFAEMYEASILSLHRLTPHQLSVLNETEGHEKVRLFAPAGAGKTFIVRCES